MIINFEIYFSILTESLFTPISCAVNIKQVIETPPYSPIVPHSYYRTVATQNLPSQSTIWILILSLV